MLIYIKVSYEILIAFAFIQLVLALTHREDRMQERSWSEIALVALAAIISTYFYSITHEYIYIYLILLNLVVILLFFVRQTGTKIYLILYVAVISSAFMQLYFEFYSVLFRIVRIAISALLLTVDAIGVFRIRDGEAIVYSDSIVHLSSIDYSIIFTAGVVILFTVHSKLPHRLFIISALFVLNVLLVSVINSMLNTYKIDPVATKSILKYAAVAVSSVIMVYTGGKQEYTRLKISKFHILFIAVIAAIWIFSMYIPGQSNSKKLNILIDEGHGDWESAAPGQFNAGFGRTSLYNYEQLVTILKLYNHDVNLQKDIMSGKPDVILIKTPVAAYTVKERLYIKRFVKRGGLLIVIGDHTNLFGITDNLNELLLDFKVQFNSDAVIPERGVDLYINNEWPNYSKLLSRGKSVLIQTPASISNESPFSTASLLLSNASFSEPVSYDNDRYFGNLVPSNEDYSGISEIASFTKYGDGGVILFGDSTMWSTFSIYFPGYYEMIHNILHSPYIYNRFYVRQIIVIILLLSLLIVKTDIRNGTFIALIIFMGLIARDSEYWKAEMDLSKANGALHLLHAHSDILMTTDILTADVSNRSVFTLFLAVMQKYGSVIIANDEIDNLCSRLLIINPKNTISAQTIEQIRQSVYDGARLLILDDSRRLNVSGILPLIRSFNLDLVQRRSEKYVGEPNTNQISDPFGFFIEELQSSVYIVKDTLFSIQQPSYLISGGHPLLVSANGEIVLAEISYGKGKVFIFYNSDVLSQAGFGDVWGGTQPSEHRRSTYDLIKSLCLYLN